MHEGIFPLNAYFSKRGIYLTNYRITIKPTSNLQGFTVFSFDIIDGRYISLLVTFFDNEEIEYGSSI